MSSCWPGWRWPPPSPWPSGPASGTGQPRRPVRRPPPAGPGRRRRGRGRPARPQPAPARQQPFAWVGPIQVLLAGLIALRPPPPCGTCPTGPARPRPRRLRLVLLILLNDTGVTATAGSGLFLLAIPAWAWLDQHRAVGQPAGQPQPRPAEARHRGGRRSGQALRQPPAPLAWPRATARSWMAPRRPGCRRRRPGPPWGRPGRADRDAPSLRLAAVVKIWPRRPPATTAAGSRRWPRTTALDHAGQRHKDQGDRKRRGQRPGEDGQAEQAEAGQHDPAMAARAVAGPRPGAGDAPASRAAHR